MTMRAISNADRSDHWVRYSLVGLIFVYSASLYFPFFWGNLSTTTIVAAQIVPAALFAFIHGSRIYRLRGMAAFTIICFVVGNLFENVGIRTGFPFGSYYFTDVMGTKLMGVPLLMGAAYLALGYTSWMLSQIILSPDGNVELHPRVFAAPWLAAGIMVVWDFSAEPMWSTVGHFWIWRHGGPYFGVPIFNFIGWLLTNYIIFQVFSLHLSRQSFRRCVPSVYWRLGVSSYMVVIATSIARSSLVFGLGPVPDATGIQWPAWQIALTSALSSLFLMGAFAFLAAKKLWNKPPGAGYRVAAMLSTDAASD